MRKYQHFSEKERKRRSGELRKIAEEESLAAIVIAGGLGSVANLYYWTNYLARSQSFYIMTRDGNEELLVGHYNHIHTCASMTRVEKIEWATHFHARKIIDALQSLKTPGRIGVVGNLSYEIVSRLAKDFGQTLDITKRANAIRSVKSEEEIAWLRKGARFTDMAVEALEKELRPGMSEFQIANIVERAYVPLGGTTRIHYLGSTSMRNPDIFVPSQNETPRKMKSGDILLTEISAEYCGYAGQLHRPISIGKPTKEYSELYDVARTAYEEILDVLRDGAASEDLVEAADRTITRKGYSICDSTVHGFGVDLMQPDLGTSGGPYENQHYVYRKNMTVVIQPNPITKERRFGLQLGNLCLVGKKRSVSMQHYPLKFITIR